MSVISVKAFLIDYSEFSNSDNLLIQRKLALAESFTPYNIWKSKQRLGIMLLTAHYIATSSIGEGAKKETDDNETTYMKERKRLEGIVSMGLGRTT